MSVIRDGRKIEDIVCETIIFREVTHGNMFARVDDVPEQNLVPAVLDPPLNTFNRDLRCLEICDLGPVNWFDSVYPFGFPSSESVHRLWNGSTDEINVRRISRSARDIIGSSGRVTTDGASINDELKTALDAPNV